MNSSSMPSISIVPTSSGCDRIKLSMADESASPADGVRHVESEEVVGIEVDVVGVHVARLRPIQCPCPFTLLDGGRQESAVLAESGHSREIHHSFLRFSSPLR